MINCCAPEVSLDKTAFQQIPYLLSGECLQQLKLLNALSLRLMGIIKPVFASPLLFFVRLETRKKEVLATNKTLEIHVQQFGIDFIG